MLCLLNHSISINSQCTMYLEAARLGWLGWLSTLHGFVFCTRVCPHLNCVMTVWTVFSDRLSSPEAVSWISSRPLSSGWRTRQWEGWRADGTLGACGWWWRPGQSCHQTGTEIYNKYSVTQSKMNPTKTWNIFYWSSGGPMRAKHCV